MIASGVLHFVRPKPFVRIVPKYLPAPLALVYISGFFEIAGGVGLLVPATRVAAAWGLINRTAPREVVAAETRTLLKLATRGSALSKGVGKRAFYRQVDLDTPSAYDVATEVMASASQTYDAQEGMQSFLQKRRPRFENR